MLQSSQENTCQRKDMSFLIKLLAVLKKETPLQVFSCEFCEVFKNTFLKKTSLRLLLDKMQI